MCGINGIFAYHSAAGAIDRDELIRTRDHMAARGPDDAALWISGDARCALGHRRLSIIDLSPAGAQPMASADGKLIVTFNGEIYNHRELRTRLEARGRTFRSQSDTEVLLHLYAERGEDMVRELRGMFAFAIWDAECGSLFLARDPYGIKPLYYADDGHTFRFASQVKALLAGGAIAREPDPAGQVGFYLWGSVPEPFTSYRDIRALPAGSTLLVAPGGVREPRSYHSIAAVYGEAPIRSGPQPSAADAEVKAEIRDAVLDSVRMHLVADVPVGAFLSAGIDSGALVGLMRDAGQADIQTVTLAFAEFRGDAADEAPLAEEVARVYGTRHTTRLVGEAEFRADLPRILEAMDQPSIDGINTWFVSKAARELGLKVAISGLGGDELFGGYPSFRDIPRWVAACALPSRVPLLGKAARMLMRPLAGSLGRSPKAAGMLEFGGSYAGAYLLRRGLFMPWELSDVLERDVVEAGLRRLAPLDHAGQQLGAHVLGAHAKVATLEASLYMRNQLLRDTDWASMAHGLEVRVPLVDSVLLHRVAALTSGAAVLHANALKTYLAHSPSSPLPARVAGRTKTGFTTPIARWLQGDTATQSRLPAAGHARQWARQVVEHTIGPQHRALPA
jgi:asparagine synthase (glutamine-hydrolysing)